MKERIFNAFIVIISLVGFIGISNVKAEDYGLWVNGEQFTSEKTTINGDSGTATLNPETFVLTLDDIKITDDSIHNSWEDMPVYYSGDNDLTIVLNGENTITLIDNSDAIHANGNLTIEGTGKLTVNMDSLPGDVIEAKNLTIDSLSLDIDIDMGNTDYSVSSDGDLWSTILHATSGNVTINNSSMNIFGPFNVGILAEGSENIGKVMVTDSNISITGVNFVATYKNKYSEFDFYQEGIAGNHIVINGETSLNIKDVGYGLDAYKNYTKDYFDASDGNSIAINDGEIYISASQVGMDTDNMSVDNYTKKIVISYEASGMNASLVQKSEFASDYYYTYPFIKMGNIETYKVTKSLSGPNVIDLPGEAFEGEIISLYVWYDEAYKIDKVQVLKTSDKSDVTNEVGYDSSKNEFTMPAYPVTVNVTLKKVFSVLPKTVSTKLDKYNSVILSWTRDEDDYSKYFRGCEIYYKKSTDKTWTRLIRTARSSYTIENLTPGVKYDFKVIPYISMYDVDTNKNVFISSLKSKTISRYTLKKLNAPKVSKRSSSKIRVKWNKISGVTKYQIARSKSKTKGFKIIKTAKSTWSSYTIKATKGKRYYYKVRACNGNVCAPWSVVKSYRLK